MGPKTREERKGSLGKVRAGEAGQGGAREAQRGPKRAQKGPLFGRFWGLLVGARRAPTKREGKNEGPRRGGAWGPRRAQKGPFWAPKQGPILGPFWAPWARRPEKAVWGGSGGPEGPRGPREGPKTAQKGGENSCFRDSLAGFAGREPEQRGKLRGPGARARTRQKSPKRGPKRGEFKDFNRRAPRAGPFLDDLGAYDLPRRHCRGFPMLWHFVCQYLAFGQDYVFDRPNSSASPRYPYKFRHVAISPETREKWPSNGKRMRF